MRGIVESKSFAKKVDAITWAAARESEIRAGGEGRVPDILFGALLERYRDTILPDRTGRRMEGILIRQWLQAPFSGISLTKIAPIDFIKWRDQRLKEVSPATVIRELGFLSSVCTHAIKEWRVLQKNPLEEVSRPPEPEARDRRITKEEIERLLYVLGYTPDGALKTKNSRIGALFLFAIETAMRAGEIRTLRRSDVDLVQRVAKVRGTEVGAGKTRAARRDVPLSSEAVRILKQLPALDETWFSVGTAASLDANFREAKKKAAIEDLHFHDTRHEAITRLSRKLDVLALARAIGHKDLKQLLVYYNETAENLALRLD
ncbi:MAG: site-specific integrase [Betaproteobacteria bacterium]|nr:site-specific integrase [Betaproteobacteria bacterium]